MTMIIGLDPGYRESALVIYDGEAILRHEILPNEIVLDRLHTRFTGNPTFFEAVSKAVLVIEQMQLFTSNYGVGQEIFDSVFWSGRFAEAWQPRRFDRILRSKVRGHLKASKGGDAAIRASLVARFGPYKEQAIGSKKQPGPLYGIKAHEWQALAIAVVWHDLYANAPEEIRPNVVAEF